MQTNLIVERQLALEEEMRGMGIARYVRHMNASEEAELPPGALMLRNTVKPLADALEAWVGGIKQGNAGKFGHIAKAVVAVGCPEVAYLTMRRAINAISGREKVTAFAIALGHDIEQEIEYRAFKEADPKWFRRIADKVQESANAAYRTKVMHLMRRRAGVDDLGWKKEDQLKVGMKLLELAIEATGMVEIATVPDGGKTINYVMGTQKAREWIANQHEHCKALSPVHLPMLSKPNKWTTPFDGGYYTHRLNLVKTPNKNYLYELENFELPYVYRSVNALQDTSWRINKRIYEVIRDIWMAGGDRAGLPQKDPKPLPNKPLDMDTNEGAVKEWKGAAREVYTFNHRNLSKVVSVAQKLFIAEKFLDEEAFHYVWTLDWRGRAYPVGSFVNPQSDDSGKALLEFSQGKALGAEGWQWLAVQLANTWGNDKCSYDDRIQWALDNTSDILGYAFDPLVNRGWMDADSPFCFLATCFEWLGYKMSGDDHICHLPIQVDGSCNGLQNFSGLLLDPRGGAAVNLIPSDVPQDVYGLVAKRASAQMEIDAAAGVPEAQVFLGSYGRKWTKRNCMTYAYSVSIFGMKDQMLEEFRRARDAGHPVDFMGCEEFKVAGYLAKLNLNAIGETVVAAKEAMDWLKEAAKVAATDNLPLVWTNPVGMPIQQAYMDTMGKKVETYVGGKRTVLTIQVAGKTLNGRKQSAGVAPNVIHSFDSAMMMRTICMCEDAGMADFSFIHDSYGTHACDMTALSDLLREAFIIQYSDNLLEKFRDELVEQLTRSGGTELAEKLPPIPKRGTLDLEAVRDSRYFFA